MASAPVISVVVPTRNRATLLPRLMSALEEQRDIGPFEVVVVDDASTDGTWAELQRLKGQARLDLRLLRLDRNSGPARARNAGWRAAAAPLIAFTDDDCVPRPRWLTLLVDGLADADLVQGCTVPDPSQGGLAGPFSRTVNTTEEWGYYETCNIAYRRAALERAGGFDEGFGVATGGAPMWGEDVDLAWRVKDAGGRSRFERDAVVFHTVWPSNFFEHIRNLPRRAGMVRAIRRNPRIRQRLPKRWFWERSHPRALLAAAGMALAARRGSSPAARLWALAFAVPYVVYRRRVRPVPLLVIPQAFVADLAEVCVLAAASVHHRTFFL
jgi:glycosyltransferase involved in cell wall biosynthesis